MGLFDKLTDIAKQAEKLNLNQIISQVANQNITQPNNSPAQQPAVNTNTAVPAQNYGGSPAPSDDAIAYYESILASDFPQYEVRKNVPLSGLGSQLDGRPYDFVLYRDGRPVSVIVMSMKGKTRNNAYWNSEKSAQAAGIPFINFWPHMFSRTPADKPFVVERIKRLMNI